MSVFEKFRCGVISKAEYDSNGVGFSTVQEDFPYLPGPGVAYGKTFQEVAAEDWWNGFATDLHVGRVRDEDDPHFRQNLWIKAGPNDLFVQTKAQDGVDGTNAFATPTRDSIPPACIVVATVTDESVLFDIENAAKHIVLGIENPDMNGDELPANLLPFDWDVTFPPNRWTVVRDGLVSIGMDEDTLDNWHDAHPDATPREFAEAFRSFIQ